MVLIMKFCNFTNMIQWREGLLDFIEELVDFILIEIIPFCNLNNENL
jgi:hypothetical protein